MASPRKGRQPDISLKTPTLVEIHQVLEIDANGEEARRNNSSNTTDSPVTARRGVANSAAAAVGTVGGAGGGEGSMQLLEIEREDSKKTPESRAITRMKVMVRALGFFYHLALAVLFTTFTELLLEDFDNSFSKTAAYLGTCAGVERGIQFFTSPFLGNLSDCFGRRPVLLGSLLLHFTSLIIVTSIPTKFSVLIYFCINGCCNVTLSMINAIVADICNKGKNAEGEMAQQYGKLGMAIGLSMILGPAVGPTLQKMNVLYPLYVSTLLLAVCLAFGIGMKETLDGQYKAQFSWRKSNPFYALRQAFKYKRFLTFGLPFFLSQLAECVYSFIVLYTKRRFGWDYILLGFYISGMGLCIAFVQGNLRYTSSSVVYLGECLLRHLLLVLWGQSAIHHLSGNLRYITPRWISENACVTFGLLGHGLAMVIMGVASSGWVMVIAVLPQMIASLKGPGLMGVMSQKVPPGEQGVLQGAIASLRVLSKAIGGPLFGAILSYSINEEVIATRGSWIIGLPFLIAATCDELGMFISWLIFVFIKIEKGEHQTLSVIKSVKEVGDVSRSETAITFESGSEEEEEEVHHFAPASVVMTPLSTMPAVAGAD